MTAASSYALRRCAIGLGDNYGLHLYHKGQEEALVRGTLLLTEHLTEDEKKEDPGEKKDNPKKDPALGAQTAARAQVEGAFTNG